MFAVMGITGNVGGAVANALLQHGKKVRGIVRDDSKAQAWKDKSVEVVNANYDGHLIAAFTDVEGVFCMIPPDVVPGFPDSVARIVAIKKAVLAAKPPQAVFLSSIGGEKASSLGLVTTAHILEEELGGTRVPSAFLRAGSFMENISHSIAAVRTTGMYFSFYQPMEDPIPLVATEDVGRIAAEILLQAWQGNRFIEISGPTYYSPNDVAAALEKALDRPVTGVAFPRETWVDTLAQHGMPAERSGAYVEMVDSFNSRWIDFGAPGTEHIKGTIDLVTAVKSLTK
ncbi:MAG: NmrA family NAD(P)-binding protein [Edaphobacter sp.]|uniref:NmrA family NAD(P)-binding protein n=1 Tax=Edaphobacter sp. TaxID=1934404 RepID=UPI0023A595BA|nr:NmrA family NAD(P)-binding protein [Edaphobacter sp.]MDE1177116.1 NmrA family NAD(P)-binding protein [Edaphobacter sp.]